MTVLLQAHLQSGVKDSNQVNELSQSTMLVAMLFSQRLQSTAIIRCSCGQEQKMKPKIYVRNGKNVILSWAERTIYGIGSSNYSTWETTAEMLICNNITHHHPSLSKQYWITKFPLFSMIFVCAANSPEFFKGLSVFPTLTLAAREPLANTG